MGGGGGEKKKRKRRKKKRKKKKIQPAPLTPSDTPPPPPRFVGSHLWSRFIAAWPLPCVICPFSFSSFPNASIDLSFQCRLAALQPPSFLVAILLSICFILVLYNQLLRSSHPAFFLLLLSYYIPFFFSFFFSRRNQWYLQTWSPCQRSGCSGPGTITQAKPGEHYAAARVH